MALINTDIKVKELRWCGKVLKERGKESDQHYIILSKSDNDSTLRTHFYTKFGVSCVEVWM